MPSQRLASRLTLLGSAICLALAGAVIVIAVRSASHPGAHVRGAPLPATGVAPGTLQSPPPATTAPPAPAHGAAGSGGHQRRPHFTPAARLATFWGIDVSWPQCDPGALPALTTGFVVVGVNDGRPFTDNPCARQQVTYATAHTGYAAYLNIDAPRFGDAASYGRKAALDGLARATADGIRAPTIWLDVETLNHWADPATNVAVINGALHALQQHGVTAGIYTAVPMWQQITGGASINVPVWLATTVTDYRDVDPLCAVGVGGHPAALAQYVATTGSQLIDVDVLCTATRSQSVPMFAAGAGGA
ncbi:MAG: hypothetical protein JO222_12560 [Frankiales bacterium]|nr:hypothetical protein [Frankiales bacterium]